MRRVHKFYRRPEKTGFDERDYPVNERIRIPNVQVITEDGQALGVMQTFKAISLAKEHGLDLVLVAPKAEPPVAKFLDYGSFKYQKEKALKKQKAQQKKIELKEIRLSPRIGKHDLDVRVKQAENFLSRGDKINIVVILRGREMQHQDLAKIVIDDFIKAVGQLISVKIEEPVKKQGNRFGATISAGAPKLD
ncbi:translation initiation factor IF-3 [Candidatus Falkowbacteria bacterium]|nr:translation initiation factor IF-3 [Candidatus Falkowbacteria bacterium]